MRTDPGYSELQIRLGFTRPLPHDPDWSAAADFLLSLTDHCLQYRPETILECSSGLSTLILARCCQLNGHGQVISLEDGAEFADASRAQLAGFGLAAYAKVLNTPLTPVRLAGREFQWYDLTRLPDSQVDLLVVDGPSGFIQPLSRYPALPLLHERLKPRCDLFLDDAGRPDEQEIVARWLQDFPEFRHEYLANQRGCSHLWRLGTPGTPLAQDGFTA